MIRILLADDHQIIREGLRALLERSGRMQVVAEASDGRTAIEMIASHTPDVVVMDITMAGMNGIDATRQIMAQNPAVKVIGLSMHAEKRFVVEMLKAGASGYLLKDCAFDELVSTIDAVLEGKTYLNPEIAGSIIKDLIGTPKRDNSSIFSILTPREREVLQLVAQGQSTKEIAALHHVSVKTIETQRQHIMEKLELHSVAELTKYAIREGLTSIC
jgi:DNA-binding NarL/FixJ family response regulator